MLSPGSAAGCPGAAAATPVLWIDMDRTAVSTTSPVCMDGIPALFHRGESEHRLMDYGLVFHQEHCVEKSNEIPIKKNQDYFPS